MSLGLYLLAISGVDNEERTEDALEVMWLDMSDRERLGFCAEVRLAGVERATREFMDTEADFDRRTVRLWLADTCAN